jgi:hypothetical protein
MKLNEFNDDQLRDELLRREVLRQAAKRPALLEKPDYAKLISACESYINDVIKNDADEDSEHWIYEEAMFALYGPKVFDKINDLME